MAMDGFGNPVSARAPAAIAAIDDFVIGMAAYHVRAANIIAAAAAMPDEPLVQVYAGFLHLLAEANGADVPARACLDVARASADQATMRERALADALEAWIADDIDRAIAVLTGVLTDHPRDLGTLKMLHYHQFNRGDFAGMLRAAQLPVAADPAMPYAWGALAFAYEQLHLMADAERAARRALELVPDDPWAQHALAHVMLTQGRVDEGEAMLTGHAPGWVDLNSFMVTHLWWHLALFRLSQGRVADALALYDDHVWAEVKDYSQDQIGAVSLLARFELAGVDVGDRWIDLGGYLAARADDVVQPFFSVQYLYGLGRAGRAEADALLAAIRRAASDGPEHNRTVWRDAALPLAAGLLAHARGDWRAAIGPLTRALPHLLTLGGSHAQRDLFEQVLLDAHVKAGDWGIAQQMLERRRGFDPDGVPVNRALGDVYDRLGLPDQARAARARADARLKRQHAPA